MVLLTINNIEPGTGRMIRENGQVINIADIWADFIAGVGLVKPTNYIYVSKGGNDTTGDGSANFPYLTVQQAINVATIGTTLFVFPGTYVESLTLKADVMITSPAKFAVTITGNHTANFIGTIVLENVILNSVSGITLAFSGTGAQNLQLIGSTINSTSGDAINWTNTNASSKILFEDGTCNVLTSGTTARCIYTSATSQGSIIANRVSFKVNIPNNVCIALNGAIAFTHTSDQIVGQVTMANTSSATIGLVAMTTTSVPILVTNSSGMSTFADVTVTTTASPMVTGIGGHTFVAVLYASTGSGGAATLNGGLGPIGLPMSAVKIRTSGLIPAAQVAAGLNSGTLEFTGTDLYITKGTIRYKISMTEA